MRPWSQTDLAVAVQNVGAMEAPHTLLFAADNCPQKM